MQPFVTRLQPLRTHHRLARPLAALLIACVWLILACVLISAAASDAQAAGPKSRPNIIVVMADDMGFSDAGCYGGEIETPNLDRMAAEGLRFSQFCNYALCGPSRSALMTGLHPHQVGISGWTGLLNDRCVTAFELFKGAGYQTCAVGRLDMVTAENWHEPANISKYVDQYFGSTGHKGPGNYFKDVQFAEFYLNGQEYKLPPEGSYKTDMISNFAADFIADAVTKDEPFFMYVSHYAPHWPLHSKRAEMEKYLDLYEKLGWDEAREARYQRLVKLGLIQPEWPLSPRDPEAGPWQKSEHKAWEASRMAAYAGQVDSLDQSMGQIFDALKKANVEENTLVLFFSDNGASNQVYREVDKPGLPWRTDGTLTRTGNDPSIPVGGPDTFVTAGPAWSNVSNTPFRKHKQSNHEGGIASPLIAWWPKVIQQRGEITHQTAHITDILASCLDIAGIAYPETYHGRKVQPPAGESLLPVFQGETFQQPRTLYWATSGSRAIRAGDWKLVSYKGGPWELYDLAADRTELNDLVKKEPQRAAKMAATFSAWKKSTTP